MSQKEFHLVDVFSQCNELEEYLRGKSLDEKEQWIATQGELIRLPEWLDTFPRYWFKSWAGIRQPFGISGDEIIIFGDHIIYPKRKNK